MLKAEEFLEFYHEIEKIIYLTTVGVNGGIV
jgi:hypothetical protein